MFNAIDKGDEQKMNRGIIGLGTAYFRKGTKMRSQSSLRVGRSLTLGILISASLSATAQPKGAAGKTPPKAAAVANAPLVKAVTAPLGMGPLKLGMSKEEIELLPAEGEIYLAKPLSEDDPKTVEGKLRFTAQVKSPLRELPFAANFAFDGASLAYMSFILDETSAPEVERQLKSKYGEPKVTVKDEEEQCLYKNGSNFKLPGTSKRAVWSGQAENGRPVQVVLNSTIQGICPSNLRYGSVSTFTFYMLSFSSIDSKPSAPAPKSNLF